MNIKSPDFFIVGAPRSGTTAMYEYLRQHPDIFMSHVKEPHFFCKDLKVGWITELDDYLKLFSNGRDKKRVGEASIYYLYSKEAALAIKEFSPQARIIVMLRNPLDMLYSLHRKFLSVGMEDIPSFKEALEAENDRKQGLRLPKSPFPRELLYYSEIAQYSVQLKRYFSVFERERVHVIIFDDFKKDTLGTYRDTLRFLGVDPSFDPCIEVINSGQLFRNKYFQRLVTCTPPFLKFFTAKIIQQNWSFRKWVYRALFSSKKNIPSMEATFKQSLKKKFLHEIQELSGLLDRNLSFWLE